MKRPRVPPRSLVENIVLPMESLCFLSDFRQGVVQRRAGRDRNIGAGPCPMKRAINGSKNTTRMRVFIIHLVKNTLRTAAAVGAGR